MRKVFETFTKSIKDISEDVTNTMTETSIRNNKALLNLNNKLLEILHDRGKIAKYLMSPSSKITKSEHASQYKPVQDRTQIVSMIF